MEKAKYILLGVLLGAIAVTLIFLFRPTDSSASKQIDTLRSELATAREQARIRGELIEQLQTTNSDLRKYQQQLERNNKELSDNQRKLAEELRRGREEVEQLIKHQQGTRDSIAESRKLLRELINNGEGVRE